MKKNKGFTLVEVIVILVILAILAAVLIPSLTTYIDKAKEKQITGNARAAYVAAQAMASEMYGLDFAIEPIGTTSAGQAGTYSDTVPVLSGTDTDAVYNTTNKAATAENEANYIVSLAQLKTNEVVSPQIYATFTGGTVTEFTYWQTVGNFTYKAEHQSTGAWIVTKTAASGSGSGGSGGSTPG